MGLVPTFGTFRHGSGEREEGRRGEPDERHAYGLSIGVSRREFDVVCDLLVVPAVTHPQPFCHLSIDLYY